MAVKMKRLIVPIENRSSRLQRNGIEVVASDRLMATNCQFMYLDLSISLHYININTEYTDN